MERQQVMDIFEAYFEKYKKTEGDRSAWSAFWAEMTRAGTLEINMTKCPKGTTFKFFVERRKVGEVLGWDAYFEFAEKLAAEYPGLYDEARFYGNMRDMT